MWLLQTQLTDEMISHTFEKNFQSGFTSIWMLVGAIAFFIVLAIINAIVKKVIKRKYQDEKAQGLFLFFWRTGISLFTITGVMFAAFAGIALLDMDMLNTREHLDEWHVQLTEITDIEKDAQVLHKDEPTRKEVRIHAFAQFKGIPDYHGIENGYSVGDSVYVVINYAGEVELVYDAEEYEYVGNRLK